MKISWILWWIVNAIWFILFIVGTIFIFTRSVDAAGIVQTNDAKIASFVVLLASFIIPVIFQIVWMIINIVVKKK